MKKSVSIFAPATIANVGSGFDVLGFALEDIGDTITLTERDDESIRIKSIEGADLSYTPEKNIVGVVLKAMCTELDLKKGFDIELVKRVMPGSGLGSSASSAAGIAMALNEFLPRRLPPLELTRFAMIGEQFVSLKPHADNVAACIYGGFTLIRSYEPLDIIQIPTFRNPIIAIIHPQIEIKTADAKKMLKKTISLDTGIKQWGNLGGLIAGLILGDYSLIGRSMEDVIAEPVRSPLIPHYDKAKKAAMSLGAIGFTIAGSGPAMFAFCETKEVAEEICSVVNEFYTNDGINVNVYISTINHGGGRII